MPDSIVIGEQRNKLPNYNQQRHKMQIRLIYKWKQYMHIVSAIMFQMYKFGIAVCWLFWRFYTNW